LNGILSVLPDNDLQGVLPENEKQGVLPENDLRRDLPVIKIIAGPTASGKTALAVKTALQAGGEIISADSMQIYEGLPIATAKPTAAELDAVPHHLIGVIPHSADFSVADYVKLAEAKAAEIISRGKVPIIAGGTGLYISSIMNGVDFSEQSNDPKIRERLRREVEERGGNALWERLQRLDPAAAEKTHPENIVRLIRALEIIEITGKKFSDYRRENRRGNDKFCFEVTLIGLSDRDALYERINNRVDLMVESGLIEECRAVFLENSAGALKKAIGYKELVPFFEWRDSLENCIEKLKQATRNYAKRQITWFRNQM
jgi:tRNA dimethylallyltransferase